MAAIRRLFDWLVIGQVVPVNPAASVRGPSHSVKRGKTPVLAPEEARALLDRIDVMTPAGLRDRALIGLMVFSFARVDAWRMVQRRAADAGMRLRIGCHTFRATGITAYLEASGTLENAQAMAAHESPRTTKLYDCTSDAITLEEIERITI